MLTSFTGAMRVAGMVMLAALIAVGGSACSSAEVPNADGYQEKILEDGSVTEAEYRQAVEASRACVEADGWSTAEVSPGVDGVTLGYSIDTPAGQETAVSKSYDTCNGTYVNQVEREYVAAAAPTGAEREQEVQELIGCLEEVGITGVNPTDTDVDVMVKITDQVSDTSDEFNAALDCMDAHSLAIRTNGD